MTSIREPGIEVPAVSDELEEERHLGTDEAIARQVIDRNFVRGDEGAVDELVATDFQPYGGRAGGGGHGGRRENRDEWDIE